MNLMDNLKMLPEFLFTVGHSMQDISRDEFSLLNGAETISTTSHTDKEMCPTFISRIQNNSPINPNALVLSKHLTTVEDNAAAPRAFTSVKLEDSNTIDLFPTHPTSWQQHPMNSHELAHHRLSVHHHRFDHSSNSKLLLQGSDDPLISHGANSVICHDDDHPADFAKCLLAATDNHPPASSSTIQERVHFSSNARSVATNPQLSQEPPQQRPIKSGCSSLTKQQLKVKANLMSARNQQQQQQQLQQKIESNAAATSSAVVPNQLMGPKQRPATAKTKAKKPNNLIKLRFHHQALPPEYLSHYEATQGQTRPTKTPKSTNSQQRPPSKQTRNSHENVRSWLQKIAEIQRTANASKIEERQVNETTTQQQPLDANNNQASSATTPVVIRSSNIEVGIVKTATKDQSHKRSHYYSDLPYMGEITLDNSKPRRGRKPKKADICHLIYKNYGTILPKRRPESQDGVNIDKVDLKYRLDNNTTTKTECEDDQPLNLCLRDQATDAYSISSADDASETNSSCATPPVTTPLDCDRDSMLANNLKNSLTNLNELNNENIKREKDPPSILLPQQQSSNVSDESMLNPITMYYQKLLESGVLLHNANGPIRTIQKDNQLALKIPIPSGLFLPPKLEKTPASASPAPSNANSVSLEYPEQLSTPSSIKSENSSATNASSSTILGTSGSQQQQAPQKRKRSAIFIPPMNIENTSNPATEVSICKFKFTGGSKPSLQEKKMLSVDAGGNYRYFSGTGDKTTRGYEYFPREMLQTAGLLPGVNCTGQKILIDIPPPSAGLSNEFLQIPESPTSSMLMTPSATTTASNGNVVTTTMSSKTAPPISPQTSTFVEISRNEIVGPDNFFEDHLEYNQSSSNSNRFLLARKKQALHQLRKSTQREKLEKTFKEQGFLIQTQQLESAEGATYCKFRQLKKFTRYLFRNWKDYLPDELQRNPNGAILATANVNEEFGHHLGGQRKGDIFTATSSAISENLSILENAIPVVREEHILE